MKKYILSSLLGAAAIFGLQAQDYKVVVTTTDGEVHTYETTDVSKITFTDAPLYAPASYIYKSEYRTQDEQGVYTMRLANCPIDEYDQPSAIGGFEVDLTMCGPLSEDRLNAELPEGYYRMGTGITPMTWDVAKTGLYLRRTEGEDGVSQHMLADGTVDVRRNGMDYDIRMECQLMTGEKFNFQYVGPLKFSLSDLENDKFTENIDIVLDGAQLRYYANWAYPFSTDATLQLYNGEWSSDGAVQIEGYWVNLPIYMPKTDDPKNAANLKIADGVYKMEGRNLNNFFNVPFTYQYGRVIDMWGTETPTDGYVVYVDRNGANKLALLKEGTMTVSDGGKKIVLDMDTDTPGVHFKATFDGTPVIHDFCNNENQYLAESTLTGNYNLNLDNGQVAFVYKNEDYIVEGLNWFELYVTDPDSKKGDYLWIHLLSKGDTLADGTYTINNALTDMTGLKGTVDPGASIILSWMADLGSTDAQGVQSVLAPIAGGTVTVTTTGDGTRKLVFDLEDNKGNLINGSYEGECPDFNEGDFAAPRRARLRH